MKKGLVSVIVINWNGKHFLKDCLKSLTKQTYRNIEIILVDNNSKDGSVQYVEKYFPQVKVIVNDSNLGFAEANNIGYRHVKGEYVLFLNNDTRSTKSCINEFVKSINKHHKMGVLQGKMLLMDNPKILDSVAAYFTQTGFLYHYGVNKPDSSKYSKFIITYSAKGACMFFKRSVLDRVLVHGNVFQSNYFSYFEETDLCHRVWLAGYQIAFEPNAVIFHKWGGTNNLLDNNHIQFNSFKNRINSYIKNLSLYNLAVLIPAHILTCYFISVVSVFRGKYKLFFAIQRAILWNILHISQTLRDRRYIQSKVRKVDDGDFMYLISKYPRLSYYYHIFFGLGSYED